MDTSIMSAAFGLAGTLVGGSMSFVSTWLVSQHNETAARQREKLQSNAKLRVACREVGEDLMDGATVAKLVIHERKWEMPPSELRLERWKEQRVVLAAELSESAWLKVAMAMDAISQLRRHMDKCEAQEDGQPDLSDDDLQQLLVEIEQGRRALNVYRDTPSWLSRLPT
jgi:hypothetical protein